MRARRPGLAGAGSKLLALGFGAAFLYTAQFYPFGKTWLAPILLLYAALLCWRRHLWLCALPALLPVLDLAPWTGWFFIEEIDLLLLLTAAFGYWQLARERPRARLPGWTMAAAAALTLAYLIGAWRGLQPWPPPVLNALDNYASPYNSLRIGKAWCWALILLPMLTRAAGDELEGLRRRFIPGMLAGLALVSGAAIWERLLFPGLSNFSSDYRTSAPFSGMHMGGAALDGYLALGFPLIGAWLLTRQPPAKNGAALILLGLAAYAGLSTFSRGLFAGYAVSGAILAAFLLARALGGRALRWRRVAAGALLAGLLVAALAAQFGASGYRGLAAALLLLAAACLSASWPIPLGLLAASAGCAIMIELILATLLPAAGLAGLGLAWPGLSWPGLSKPPYLLFLLAAAAFAGVALRAGAAPPGRAGLGAALIALAGLALNTGWIGHHWAGPAAHGPAALIVAIALAPVALAGARRAPLWRLDRARLSAAAAAAVVLMLALPIGASYYAGQRFGDTRADLAYRLRHWSRVVRMMDDDAATRSFGMGLGTFPATYFWRNTEGETPASFHYGEEAGNRFLQLAPAHYAAGYGELLRLLQRLTPRPASAYLFQIDVRGRGGPPHLHVNLCQRLLLYQQNCIPIPLASPPPDQRWHHYQLALDSGGLGAGPWPLRAPVQLELAVEGGTAALDIDNLSLRALDGDTELIKNGGFSATNDYWFFSSDRHHLPWHAKNLALDVYFQLGWFGLAALSALLLAVCRPLLRRAAAGQAAAALWLAALAGFLVVGLFDSLLDVPRLALLFFLVLLCAALQASAPAGQAPPSRP